MDATPTEAVLSLAATQHSLFTTKQALTCGLSHDELGTWARHGRIARASKGVWMVAGAAPTRERDARAVLLAHGHGAVLCRSSAAWCWEVPGHPLAPVQVLRGRDQHLPGIATARTSRALAPCDITQRRGLRVTAPTRTIFDLAGTQHPDRTRRDLNGLMARGLTTLELLDEALDRLAAKGRSGIATMRALIAEAHEKGAPAGSNLELTAEEILGLAGMRAMRRQVEICDADGFVARVDFGDPHLRLIVEVDSDRFHHGPVDRQLDDHKTARLEASGWTVIRVTEQEIWHGRTALVNRLRQAAWEARRARMPMP
jgi:very-short-patch-repair endonuclease